MSQPFDPFEPGRSDASADDGSAQAEDPLGPVPDLLDGEPGPGPRGTDPVSDDFGPDDFGPDDAVDEAPVTVESLLDDVERLTAERDKLLDDRMRDRAEYENTRRRQLKQHEDQIEHAGARLVEDLLPVLDACDAAMVHGATEVEPLFASLLGALEKGGLDRIDPLDEEFDPNRQDAVMHEPGDDDRGPVVVDVLRRGYAWKGRVLRPAMVKVRG